jgi:hypothetical protein
MRAFWFAPAAFCAVFGFIDAKLAPFLFFLDFNKVLCVDKHGKLDSGDGENEACRMILPD